MKKILEVLQYGENDIRFNTDIDVEKSPEKLVTLTLAVAMTMATKLWGGNERSVIAVIRALAIADMSCCVHRRQMIRMLDEESGKMARAMSDALEAFRKDGGKVLSFSPGIQPPKAKS